MVEIEQFFEDYEVGYIRTTMGRTITETDIVTHAMHSGDFYPHHTDAEFAKKDHLVNALLNSVVHSQLVLLLLHLLLTKEHLLMVLKDCAFLIQFSLVIQFILKSR